MEDDDDDAAGSSGDDGDTVVADSQPKLRRSGRAAAARGRGGPAPAPVRLSERQLTRMIHQPLPVSLCTPEGGLPETPAAKKKVVGGGGGDPAGIPIPGVTRVASPWATPALATVATPATGALPPRLTPASGVFQGRPTPPPSPAILRRPKRGAAAAAAASGGGDDGDAPAAARRAAAAVALAAPPSRFGPGAAAARRPPQAVKLASEGGGPWTQPRAWDAGARRRRPRVDTDENAPPPSTRPPSGKQGAAVAATQAPAATPAVARLRGVPTPAAPRTAARATPPSSARAAGSPAFPATTDRVIIALTSVGDDVAAAARAAVRRLPGASLCPDGREDCATHLVLGAERRTLKTLLAVAAGAHLVTPAWLHACASAGAWLPPGPHAAASRFAAASAHARTARAAGAPAPLAGERVHVHVAGPGADAGALARVAAALGADAAPGATDATLCVVAGGGAPPPGLPAGAAAVGDEWLLLAAEQWQRPSRIRVG